MTWLVLLSATTTRAEAAHAQAMDGRVLVELGLSPVAYMHETEAATDASWGHVRLGLGPDVALAVGGGLGRATLAGELRVQHQEDQVVRYTYDLAFEEVGWNRATSLQVGPLVRYAFWHGDVHPLLELAGALGYRTTSTYDPNGIEYGALLASLRAGAGVQVALSPQISCALLLRLEHTWANGEATGSGLGGAFYDARSGQYAPTYGGNEELDSRTWIADLALRLSIWL